MCIDPYDPIGPNGILGWECVVAILELAVAQVNNGLPSIPLGHLNILP